MKNKHDDEDEHDYKPNELAELSLNHCSKYRQIVESNLAQGDTVEAWEQRNLERMQSHLQTKQIIK